MSSCNKCVHFSAPDLGSDDNLGVWRIDDMDHSFSSQPFRIRYARQDILLSVMISFNLSLGKFEVSLSLSHGCSFCGFLLSSLSCCLSSLGPWGWVSGIEDSGKQSLPAHMFTFVQSFVTFVLKLIRH